MPKSLNLDNKTSDFLKTVKLCQKNKTSTANSGNKFYFSGNFLVEKFCTYGPKSQFTQCQIHPLEPKSSNLVTMATTGCKGLVFLLFVF